MSFVSQVRVLLLDLPAFLRDLTAEVLAREPWISVVDGPSGGSHDIAAAAGAAGAAVVVCGTHGPEPSEGFQRLVRESAGVRALAITADGRRASLYVPVSELTPAALVAAIRQATP